MALRGRYFGGGVENTLPVLSNELYVCIYISEPEDIAGGVAEVEIAVAVPRLRPVDELVCAAEPVQRIERLHISVVMLGEDGLLETAVRGPVHIEPHILLSPVQHLDEDVPAVRGPGDVGQVLVVAEVIHLHVNCGVGRDAVDSETHILRTHAVHRVFDVPERARPRGDVQEREIGHQCLVLAVECDFPAVRRPENASVDAELVAAHRLSVCNVAVLADGNGIYVAQAVDVVQALVNGECYRLSVGGPRNGCCALRKCPGHEVCIEADAHGVFLLNIGRHGTLIPDLVAVESEPVIVNPGCPGTLRINFSGQNCILHREYLPFCPSGAYRQCPHRLLPGGLAFRYNGIGIHGECQCKGGQCQYALCHDYLTDNILSTTYFCWPLHGSAPRYSL